jgi:predicted ATPase/DNA-binding SARP family transcriptional activator
MDTAALRLRLLGAPTAEWPGREQPLPLDRRSQLLALLALRRGWVARSEAAALLWPEQPARLANANLRKTLFRLAAWGWAPAVEVDGLALRCEPATDVLAFDAALAAGRLDEALALYRGPLLAGFDDGQAEAWTRWLEFERERLRLGWRGAALQRLADASFDPAAAVSLSARLLDDDPLDETACAAHLRALLRDGQVAAARAAWRRYGERLAQELGVEPGVELRALHDSLLAAPAAGGVPARRTPSDAADAGFVGRTVELQRLTALLARDDCRLVCIIGAGGVGKTRLARHALHALAPGFAAGALFVELDDVATPTACAARLAQALGAGASRDALQAAAQALRGRPMLLVLDNFEPIAEHAAALLPPLLQAEPGLKLLITSRVRLGLAGEWSLPLDGLPCPDPEDADRAAEFDAVRLFMQAAQRVQPALALGGEVAAVVDICRQVDGLPLALELAAAWARVLSCAEIADELRRGSALLRAQDSGRPARHASIEQVFEQSWARLGAAEREALARLSVFRGGFGADGARAVAGVALPVLSALADKSLLRKEGSRLSLHPLVQQLAAARLGDDASRALTEAAHAAYFHQRLAQWRAGSESGERTAMQALDADLENCLDAWRWSVARGETAPLAVSLRTLLNYFDHRGRFDEGLALLRSSAASAVAARDAALRGALLAAAAHLAYRSDRYDDATAMATQALALARRDRTTRQQAVLVLATCALRRNELANARRRFRHALALSSPQRQPQNQAATLDHLALVEKRLGHYEEAQRLGTEALLLYRRLGDAAGTALCLNNLGDLQLTQRRWHEAAVYLREGLAVAEREGYAGTRLLLLANLMEAALELDDPAGARAYGTQALELGSQTGDRAARAWLRLQLARVAVRERDDDGARAHLAEGADLALALQASWLQAGAAMAFAELLQAHGEAAAARRLLGIAAAQPGLAASVRAQVQLALARAGGPPDAPWHGPPFEALLQRLAVERALAHAPLIELLRGSA